MGATKQFATRSFTFAWTIIAVWYRSTYRTISFIAVIKNLTPRSRWITIVENRNLKEEPVQQWKRGLAYALHLSQIV